MGPYSTADEPLIDPLASPLDSAATLRHYWLKMRDAPAAAPTGTTESDMGYYRAGGDLQMVPSHTSSSGDSEQLATDDKLGPSRRRPRMNVTNVHALRRSMRRVIGFAKVARKVMTFTAHHKMKTRRRKR